MKCTAVFFGRVPVGACFLVAASFVLSACGSPTEVRNTGAITLRISAPPSLLVHQQMLFTVRAVNEHGVQVALPQPPVWTSSASTVASVAPTGVVKGLGRGEAVITVRAGATSAAVPLKVRARVRIAPEYLREWSNIWPLALAVGDSLQFTAHYVDVNGVPINDTPSTTWASSDPAGVSVSGSGLVVAVRAWSNAVVTASTADGLDSTRVSVGNAIAGLPASIRFAHAVRGSGPVTFFPSKGAPVTLSYGESVERPILSGRFLVRAAGMNGSGNYEVNPAIIRGGDRLELYAVNDWGSIPSFPGWAIGSGMWVVPAWGAANVPRDSALVRFIQSSPFIVFDVRPPHSPASGNPRNCYFDPGDLTEYAPLSAGDFDFVLKKKDFQGSEIARIRATAPGGRAVTYVVIGETAETVGLLAFPDP